MDKCSYSNARFSNSDMRVRSVSSIISMNRGVACKYCFSGVSKVPEMYEYINLQSWILYTSINLVIPNCLNSGAVGALYIVL